MTLLPCARDITRIRVTETPLSNGRVRVEITWEDRIGDGHHLVAFCESARRIQQDLAACCAISEETRYGYLLGLIRRETMVRFGVEVGAKPVSHVVTA